MQQKINFPTIATNEFIPTHIENSHIAKNNGQKPVPVTENGIISFLKTALQYTGMLLNSFFSVFRPVPIFNFEPPLSSDISSQHTPPKQHEGLYTLFPPQGRSTQTQGMPNENSGKKEDSMRFGFNYLMSQQPRTNNQKQIKRRRISQD